MRISPAAPPACPAAILAVATLAVATLAATILATTLPARADDLPVVNVNNEVGIAVNAMLQNYQEHGSTGIDDSESGWLPGLQAKFSTMFDALGISNLYAAARYTYNSGTLGYNGALLNGTPATGNSGATINNVDIELGKGFLLSRDLLLTPFVQGGYRDWQRDLQMPSGYNENYSNGYMGVGLRGDYALNDRLVLTGRLGWAETFGAAMTASGGALAASGIGPMNFGLGDTPLLQAGIGADYLLANRIHLYGGLDYTHFGFGQSAVNGEGFYEPSSTTSDFAIRIGFAFGF